MPKRGLPIRVPTVNQRGFTLVELVAAFAIFVLGFGILLQVLSSCLHTTTQSADYTRAALWAQSLLDTQGVGEALQEGDVSGRFDDRYSWHLSINKIQPPEEPQGMPGAVVPGNANVKGPQVTTLGNNVDLYQLELVVTWGTFYMTHNARFVTLRAISSDAANGAPGLQPPPVRQGGRP
jgi:general secretion pathway protein I